MKTDKHKDQLTLHGYGEVEEVGGRCGWGGCGFDREEIEGDSGVQQVVMREGRVDGRGQKSRMREKKDGTVLKGEINMHGR